MSNTVAATITWLNDPAHWRDTVQYGPGIPSRVLEHLEFSGIAVGIAALIALPLGVVIGHRGGGNWIVAVANALRALPTFGLLILFVVAISPHIHSRGQAVYLIPTEIVLVILAIPAILANTVAGIQNVDPAARDAARGMGMTGRQVLFQVEVPNALPLIISGIRSAALQVIATATIAAYVTLGGLGRFIFDGLGQHDYAQMTAGALLVAVLAVLVDLVFAGLQRYGVSRGVSGRFARSTSHQPNAASAAMTAEVGT